VPGYKFLLPTTAQYNSVKQLYGMRITLSVSVPGIRIERDSFVTVQGSDTFVRFSCQIGLTVTHNMTAFWNLTLCSLVPIC
jgi:hypothetical protein